MPVCSSVGAVNAFPWAQKRVLVTGGAGFFGSLSSTSFRRRGATEVFVTGAVRLQSGRPRRLQARARHARPDIVFHLRGAGRRHRRESRNPGLFLYDNAMIGPGSSWRSAGSRRSQDDSSPGTDLRRIRSLPRSRSARTTSGTAMRGDQRAVRAREEAPVCCAGAGPIAISTGMNTVMLFRSTCTDRRRTTSICRRRT